MIYIVRLNGFDGIYDALPFCSCAKVLVGLSNEKAGLTTGSIDLSISSKLTTTHMVWYILFIIFVTYAVLPLPLLWSLAAAGATVVVHLTTFLAVHYSGGRNNPSPWEVYHVQIMSKSFFYDDNKQPTALRQHRSMGIYCRKRLTSFSFIG